MNIAFPIRPEVAALAPLLPSPGAEERSFYDRYTWTLNPYPKVGEALEHLHAELAAFNTTDGDWQRQEIATNIYLLTCGIVNCADEYLRGSTLQLPARALALPPLQIISQARDYLSNNPLAATRNKIRLWRDALLAALRPFLRGFAEAAPRHELLVQASQALLPLLEQELPDKLQRARIGVPSPFRRLDMSHVDVLALAHRLIERFPDRSAKLALVGLRTSGTYFVPLIEACLLNAGYSSIETATFDPGKRPGVWEKAHLRKLARDGFSAIVVDDPPHSGSTIFAALRTMHKLGFASETAKVLVPLHPARLNWSKPLPDDRFIVLPPQHWHKQKLLESENVKRRLEDYLQAIGRSIAGVTECSNREDVRQQVQALSGDARAQKLSRVFEVRFTDGLGADHQQLVLARSTGWGWLGYHGFLIADRCKPFLPGVFGLRDGILYMECIPQTGGESAAPSLETLGRYIATRAKALGLETGKAGAIDLKRHNNGLRLLEKSLSRNFGPPLNAIISRSGVRRELMALPCALPAAIDANVGPENWINSPRGVLKIDFERHGLGKGAVNAIDPAFDIADAILNFRLSRSDEEQLLRNYIDACGDKDVEGRLFVNKLMAGIWNMNAAQELLVGKPTRDDALQAHARFMRAWAFLTVETARYCGRFYRKPGLTQWRAPLVSLDIDGVIDQRLMGFPATTAAGIQALGLLVGKGTSVIVNTARSVDEVQAYCDAYGLSGAVAEHGGYAWDAIARRGMPLISAEAEAQLDSVRSELRRIPGVYLDERHSYSVRAFTYAKPAPNLVAMIERMRRAADVGDGALAPLPNGMASQIIADKGLDLLDWHDTTIDTTFTAKTCNKGTGLVALRRMVLSDSAETVAMGDQKPDLDMFSVASRSYAPANVSCPDQAKLLGCRITSAPYQRGLLEMARELTGTTASAVPLQPWDQYSAFILSLLQAADRGKFSNLAHILLRRAGLAG